MAMKLPMRFRILHLMSLSKSLSDVDIMEALKDEYGSEGQYKLSIINTHIQSMRAVGMIENTEASLDKKGNLKQRFKITEYGIGRLKYLPKEWTN